jgi:hypothetical protein
MQNFEAENKPMAEEKIEEEKQDTKPKLATELKTILHEVLFNPTRNALKIFVQNNFGFQKHSSDEADLEDRIK